MWIGAGGSPYSNCKRHPSTMGGVEIEAFLTHLAVVGQVSASTQNQARLALLFLYRDVLGEELPWLDGMERAQTSRPLPVVLTHAEVAAVLGRLKGVHALLGRLLYGTGMRLMEGMRLRGKDVEFERKEIIIRDGKGFKDRVTMLPAVLIEPLKVHLIQVKILHEDDMRTGCGSVYLPYALERKYPNAGREWAGNTCFRPCSYRSIPVPARRGATIWTKRRCNGR